MKKAGIITYNGHSYRPEEEKGLSLLILKTQKGENIFQAINSQYVCRRIGLEKMGQKERLWMQHQEHHRAKEFRSSFLMGEYNTLEELVWSSLLVSGKKELEAFRRNYAVFGGWNTREVLRRLVDDSGRNKLSGRYAGVA